MKKLLYTSFMFSALFINACKTNNGSKITAGVKVISKCCEKLSGNESKSEVSFKSEDYETVKNDRKVSTIFPAAFWDTKMMIW